jgi:signal transduction histidine kinase
VSAFANLPISRKLMAAFFAVVVVIFASSAIVYDRLRVIEWAKDWRIHTTDVLETLQTAMDAIVDQEAGVSGYFITRDERFLEPYHRGGSAYTVAIQKLRDLTSDNPGQQSRLDELDELAKNGRSIAEREIALIAKPETREDARALVASTAARTATDLIRAKVDEIGAVERDLLAKRDAAQNEAFATAYTMTILGGAASVIIATLMGVLLTRGIVVPITRMTNAMTTLAKGDTTVEVPRVDRSDEIGAMAVAVQIFKDSMIERERAQAELAHVNRVTTMGHLTGSIAHEVNQPVAAMVTQADAALRWLGAQPPDLAEAREALGSIIVQGNRAGDIIRRIRTLIIKKVPTRNDRFDINEAISEVIALTRSEVLRNGVSLQTLLAKDLPLIQGDRVQLQQVILNLIVNAVQAMSGVSERSRELLIGSRKDASTGVLVTVRDSGPGLDPESFDHLFDAFYTTKPGGMGMGLSICRSIIEAHGGKMWATANIPQGAIFQFTLPAHRETAS